MAISTPTELLDWLERNQFLSAAQAGPVRPLLINMPDNMALAKELIRRDWLTPFQVNQIMKGQEADLVLGPYRLRERIGEGAMGAVFKAWNLRLGRVVAVKTLNKAMIDSPKALERFRREAQTAAQLDHPNIALVRDADEIDGRPYLIMDFIEGANLSQRVKKEGALPIGAAAEFTRQAALGLQHAFERGIIHRDIKPSNLIVTQANHDGDARPLVKVLDFGLARFQSVEDDDNRLTKIGHMVGTVDYVAPEQAQDARTADIRADIYALGCTLFYLLAGKPPFPGESIVEKLGPRVTGEAPWVRTVRPDVPPALEDVVRKMMARKPQDRWQTPIEVAQALQPFAKCETAPALALALPVTAPANGGVVMATLVNTPGAAPVAQALPIAPAPPPSAPAPVPLREAAFIGMSASGRDLSTPASAATPRPRKPLPVKLVAVVASGALVSVLLCTGLLFLLFGGKPDKKKGTIDFADKTRFSMGDGQAVPGHTHWVNVIIKRIDFKGPVKVFLKDLPSGVNSQPATIPANLDRIELRFTVSLGTLPLTKQVHLVAECEQAGARAEMPLTLIVKEDPFLNKKG